MDKFTGMCCRYIHKHIKHTHIHSCINTCMHMWMDTFLLHTLRTVEPSYTFKVPTGTKDCHKVFPSVSEWEKSLVSTINRGINALDPRPMWKRVGVSGRWCMSVLVYESWGVLVGL